MARLVPEMDDWSPWSKGRARAPLGPKHTLPVMTLVLHLIWGALLGATFGGLGRAAASATA